MKNIQVPKQTRWERALTHLAPGYARRIWETRYAFQQVGSMSNSARNIRTGWSRASGDADADILPRQEDDRTSSRDLYYKSGIGGAIIDTHTTSVIGKGLRLQSTIDKEVLGLTDAQAAEAQKNIEREYNLFSSECDITGRLHLRLLQSLAMTSQQVNGDVLVTTPYIKRPGDTYGTKVQLIESDRVSNPQNGRDTSNLSGGVERDKYGMHIKFHVQTTHPGSDVEFSRKWESVNAYNKLGQKVAWLLYDQKRVGQNRGVSMLNPVIELIKQSAQMTEYELRRAVISSLFTVFIQSESTNVDTLNLGDDTQNLGDPNAVKLESGMMINLASNETPIFSDPKTPNVNMPPFLESVFDQIGARVGVPSEILLKKFSTSFTAAQAAFLEAWRGYLRDRFVFAEKFSRPIYELFFTEAVAAGRINAPGFLSGDPLIRRAWLGSQWIGDAKGHIMEPNAIKAAVDRISAGLSNKTIETQELTGLDWETVNAVRSDEIKKERENQTIIERQAQGD